MKTKIYDLDAVDTSLGSEVKQPERINPVKDFLSAISNSLNVDLPVGPDIYPTFDPRILDISSKAPDLSDIYPSGNKKYRVPRKILSLLSEKPATLFQIAKCIDSKLTKDRFKYKPELKDKVKHAIKSLNKNLKPSGYFITTKLGIYELTKR